jgi:molybdopterin-guanine dinucleotide biosynthesis protein MobB
MTTKAPSLPLIGFCAYSGTGKTTLLRKLLPLLRAQGLRVAVVKHAHHSFEMDYPGKDSYELRKSGADCCIVVSRQRVAMVEELPQPNPEPRLDDALRVVDPDRFDLVVVEGFKHEAYPKVELHRPSLGKPLLHADDSSIIALATDAPVKPARPIPVLDLNAPATIRDFVLARLPGNAAAVRSGAVEATGRLPG